MADETFMPREPARTVRAVSLGVWCQVAHQLAKHDLHIPGPFDDQAGSFDGLVGILRGDYEPGPDAIPYDGTTVIGAQTRVIYHHAFRRDAAGVPLIDDRSKSVCQRQFRIRMAALEKTLADEGEVVFIRQGGKLAQPTVSPYLPDSSNLLSADYDALTDALDKRFPGLAYRVAIVFFDGLTRAEPSANSRVSLHPMTLPDEAKLATWEGDDNQWARLMSSLPLVPA